MKKHIALVSLVTGALLAGCSGGLSTNGTSVNPPVTQSNLSSNKLEFAVGTVNFQGSKTYLNTVVSYRQPNGNSVLLDTPTISGPTGFTVPASSQAGVDAGTSNITGTPQTVPQTGVPAPATGTFGQSGGAFEYGFAPLNSTTTGSANYPGNPSTGSYLYFQPFYVSSSTQLGYYGGPPAFPFFNDGTWPQGFRGFQQGFTMFGATPVTGTYNLNVVVPASNATPVTASASATLNTATPVVGVPTITNVTKDGSGGLTGTVTPGSGATETLVYITDCGSDAALANAGLPAGVNCASRYTFAAVTGALSQAYYTVGPFNGTAAASFTLPNNIAACSVKGCTGSSPTIPSGDDYVIVAVSFDYPAFESAPPMSKTATPTISGSNGQADLGISAYTTGTY